MFKKVDYCNNYFNKSNKIAFKRWKSNR